MFAPIVNDWEAAKYFFVCLVAVRFKFGGQVSLSSGQLIDNFLYTYFLVLSTIGYATLIFIWHSTHILMMEALGHTDDEIVSCLVSDF